MSSRSPEDEYVLIFRKCFRHAKTGKVICKTDGGFFALKVKKREHQED